MVVAVSWSGLPSCLSEHLFTENVGELSGKGQANPCVTTATHGVGRVTRMTRTLFTGGLVYDGTTGRPAEGDVTVEDGRIVEVGSGLDGDEVVDCSGAFVSPGFYDCHVHVVMDTPNFIEMIEDPFSLQFFKAARNLK